MDHKAAPGKKKIRVEFSGLGGSHVLEEPFVADLFEVHALGFLLWPESCLR